MFMTTPPLNIPERAPLRDKGDVPEHTSYGSIIATPPLPPPASEAPSLLLPDPALDPSGRPSSKSKKAASSEALKQSKDPYHIGKTNSPHKPSFPVLPPHRNPFRARRTLSTPGQASPNPRPRLIQRMFSTAAAMSPASVNISLEAYRELDIRQEDFFSFLDRELDKIEKFYKTKEDEANERLQILRDQLHELRDRRLEELLAAKQAKDRNQADADLLTSASGNSATANGGHKPLFHNVKWMKPIEDVITRKPKIGRTTKAMEQLASPAQPRALDASHPETRSDYVRRPTDHHGISYRAARRKLKLALQEFYRSLELLKSYALLNRTAFRKINKKYDKAANARPTGRYMSEKINKAWFVQSDVIESHIVAVEDLYARYFERGNRKVAVGKLRSKSLSSGDYSGSTFRNGLLLAGGLVFGIQGLTYGAEKLFHQDPTLSTKTAYLLQIYGGYFLALLLFLLFTVNCRIWTVAKINYVFIFEYDTRHVLDWRQLAELPCLLLFLEGLFLWLNFQQAGSNSMYIYWPVILIGLSLIILLFPAPTLYHRSREWWAYSHWRLALAGLYPVEFRDFFLGDMYCSQTFAMGNIELFFCLYAQNWTNLPNCNSSHSRLLGFFSTLPGIWRALQCLRRYYDTRNTFPHLVNCGKYIFTILYYMTLSLWRIHKVAELKAVFVTFALLNSIYTSIWDLGMDWSLGNPYARYPFLRDVLGYRRPWVYYAAMILDPILRFSWIFYAIYSNDVQHSAILSFLVALAEVIRRFIWVIFRVENEHCTNVGRFRASRDIPLPYSLPSSTKASDDRSRTDEDQPQPQAAEGHGRDRAATGVDVERPEVTSGSLRLRKTRTPQTPVIRGIARVGTLMASAHAQDFERKKRPGVSDGPASEMSRSHHEESSDEDESVQGEDDASVDEEVVEAQRMLSRGQN